MFITKILIYCLAAIQQQESYPLPVDSHIQPSAGLLVAVDPETLIGEGLNRAWRCIDESFENRHVKSRPLSKVNFKLKPLVSHNGAVIELDMNGTSVGESVSNSQSVEIVSDSLTKFKARQTLFLSTQGIGFSEPLIGVSTTMNVKRTNSGNRIFAGALTRSGIRHFPEYANEKAEQFARKQVERNLYQSMMRLTRNLQQRATRFNVRFPILASLGWHACSDSQKIYLASHEYGDSHQTPPRSSEPVAVSLHENFANGFLDAQWSGNRYDSDQITNWLNRFNSNATRTANTPEKTAANPWAIRFSANPIEIRFDNDSVQIQIELDSFEADDRVLPPAQINAEYLIMSREGKWQLDRTQQIGIEGSQSGARQQIIRSIMRKRLETVLPDSIRIPELQVSAQMKRNELGLRIKRITTNNQYLVVELDHR